jgi:hypothetical protein
MGSRAFTIASGVSLAIAVALAVLWGRSATVMDGVMYCDPSGSARWTHCLHTRHGALHYLLVGPPQTADPGWTRLNMPQPAHFVSMVDRPRWQVLGFARGGGGSFSFLSVPFWFLLLLALLAPGLWLVSRVRRRLRPKAGRCARCGYDLRAGHDRCPECGESVPQQAS